jgi:hypothetical protein
MTTTTVSLYVAPETTFGSDPDADGSDYLACQITGKPLVQTALQVVESGYATGRNRRQVYLVGRDGASLSTEHPLISLASVASDGAAPPSADWLDAIISAALGSATSKSGEGLASGGTTTSVVMDTDAFDVDELLCVNHASNSEWRPITADAGGGTYTVSPALDAAPNAARDALGYRYWAQTDTPGATITAYTELGGTGYRLSGGRPGLSLEMAAGAETMKLSAAWAFDSKSREAKASLPAISQFANTPIKAVLSPVHWGSTKVSCKSVKLNFNLSPTDILSTAGTNGRASIDNLMAMPTIEIEPAFSTSIEDDFAAGTERSLIIQFGSGVLGGGRANTWCFYARSAQVIGVQPVDDGNYLRQRVTLAVTDPGIRTGSTPYRGWILARA